MFKFLIEIGLTVLIALMLVTQVLLPMFISNLTYFWFFTRDKKKDVKEVIPDVNEVIQHLADDIKDKKQAFTQSSNKIDDVIHTLTEAKGESN